MASGYNVTYFPPLQPFTPLGALSCSLGVSYGVPNTQRKGYKIRRTELSQLQTR